MMVWEQNCIIVNAKIKIDKNQEKSSKPKLRRFICCENIREPEFLHVIVNIVTPWWHNFLGNQQHSRSSDGASFKKFTVTLLVGKFT